MPTHTEDTKEMTVENIVWIIKILAMKAGTPGRPWEEFERMVTHELTLYASQVREEAVAREKQLKEIHTMELDAISCKSIEDFVIWRDYRKQRPKQAELTTLTPKT